MFSRDDAVPSLESQLRVSGLGKSIVITGEIRSEEDLTIEGRVDGTIEMGRHTLTVGEHAKIAADVSARSVVILGEVRGIIAAAERVEIHRSGRVEAEVAVPRLLIADGAEVRGRFETSRIGPEG